MRTISVTRSPGWIPSAAAVGSSAPAWWRAPPGTRGEALLAQQVGNADDARQVALDLAAADEGAAAPAGHPAHRARLFEQAERLAQGGTADAHPGRDLPLGPEPLTL
ncbi:hypothetical protein Misp02_56750 [Microtetraspora sp. NBRC 16547]|nr:hypothetical protein Misp02_56750 [Microtetraspora sp. NBRC 16547]